MCANYVESISSNVPFADGEGDDGGVVSGEEVLVAGLEFPQFLLRELSEPCASQTVLGFVDGVESRWRSVEEVDKIGNEGVGGDLFLRHCFSSDSTFTHSSLCHSS